MGKLFKVLAFADPDARHAAGLRAMRVIVSGMTMLQAPIARPRCPASATPSSPARAACRTASTRASTAASARTTRPRKVAENRARMAAALGVAPEQFLTCYQIHSPNVVVADEPWTATTRPRADAIVTRDAGPRASASRPPIAGRCCSPIRRRGVIGAAHAGWRGALDRRARGDRRRDGKARREARAHRRRGRPDDPPAATTRSARIWSTASSRPTPDNARFFAPATRRATRCSTCRAISPRGLQRAGIAQVEDLGALHLCRSGAVLHLPPHHPPRRAGLRPAHQRDRARRLTLSCGHRTVMPDRRGWTVAGNSRYGFAAQAGCRNKNKAADAGSCRCGASESAHVRRADASSRLAACRGRGDARRRRGRMLARMHGSGRLRQRRRPGTHRRVRIDRRPAAGGIPQARREVSTTRPARARSPWCRARAPATYRVRGYVSRAGRARQDHLRLGLGRLRQPTSAARCASPARNRPPPSRRAATPGRGADDARCCAAWPATAWSRSPAFLNHRPRQPAARAGADPRRRWSPAATIRRSRGPASSAVRQPASGEPKPTPAGAAAATLDGRRQPQGP